MAKHETEMHRQLRELRAEREDLLWLVCRAQGLRNVTRWSKAEKERSWADWDMRAMAAIAKADKPMDIGLFGDHSQMDLADRKDVR